MRLSKRLFKNILNKLNIKKGDLVLVNSNILDLILDSRKELGADDIIEILKKKITKSGTLIFPTYSWEFCKKKKFDYKKTKSFCGALSNFSLQDKEFIRTKNPIFSFTVFGKNKHKLSKLHHSNCFSLKSIFGYLIKNNGKNLFINLKYNDANTFVHVAEQAEKIKYRYIKNFSGIYINELKKKKKMTVKMFVRKKYVKSTVINKRFEEILKRKKIINNIVFNKMKFSVLNIPLTFKNLREQIRQKTNLITYN